MSISKLLDNYIKAKVELTEALDIESWENVSGYLEDYWYMDSYKNCINWGKEKDNPNYYEEEVLLYKEVCGYAVVYAYLSTGEKEYLLFSKEREVSPPK